MHARAAAKLAQSHENPETFVAAAADAEMPAVIPATPVSDGVEMVGCATPAVALTIEITVVSGAPARVADAKSDDVKFALSNARADAAAATAAVTREQLAAAAATLGSALARRAADARAASTSAAYTALLTRSVTTTVRAAAHENERCTLPDAPTLAATSMDVGGSLGTVTDTSPAEDAGGVYTNPNLVTIERWYAAASADTTAGVAAPGVKGSTMPPLHVAETFWAIDMTTGGACDSLGGAPGGSEFDDDADGSRVLDGASGSADDDGKTAVDGVSVRVVERVATGVVGGDGVPDADGERGTVDIADTEGVAEREGVGTGVRDADAVVEADSEIVEDEVGGLVDDELGEAPVESEAVGVPVALLVGDAVDVPDCVPVAVPLDVELGELVSDGGGAPDDDGDAPFVRLLVGVLLSDRDFELVEDAVCVCV